MFDLTAATFIPEFVQPATFNDVPLEYGCVVQSSYEMARIGKNSMPTVLTTRVRESATIFVRTCEPAFAETVPKIGDILVVGEEGTQTTYRVLDPKTETNNGSYELICEVKGSRRVTTAKTGTYNRG